MKILQLLLICFIVVFLCNKATATFYSYPQNDTFPNPRKLMERRRELMQVEDTSLTAEQYSELTGRKLSPFEKRRFERMQVKQTAFARKHGIFRFKASGFLLGLFLGPIGVAAAYIFFKDRNVRRSAWIGLGGFVLIASFITLMIIIINAANKI